MLQLILYILMGLHNTVTFAFITNTVTSEYNSSECELVLSQGEAGKTVGVCINKITGFIDYIQHGSDNNDTGENAKVFYYMLPGSGTVLEDCITTSVVVNGSKDPSQQVIVTRTMVCSPNFYHDQPNATVTVVDTFTTTPHRKINSIGRSKYTKNQKNENDEFQSSSLPSIEWTLNVWSDDDRAWSTAIITSLGYANFSLLNTRAWVGGPAKAMLPTSDYSPLEPFSVNTSNMGSFYYGTKQNDINHPKKMDAPSSQIPVLSRLDYDDSGVDVGITLANSPMDTPIVAFATIGRVGSHSVYLNFTRQYHRFGSQKNTGTLRTNFSMYILAHSGCWRPAIQWMQNKYPSFFNVHPSVNISDIEGTSSYADLRGPSDMNSSDAEHYLQMGYRLNWDSTARFPWHGEWIPVETDGFNDTWLCCFTHAAPDHHTGESCSNPGYHDLNMWYEHQRQMGFRTCAYGNLFEFGWNVASVYPHSKINCSNIDPQDNHTILSCHTKRLLDEKYGESLIFNARNPNSLVCGGLDGSCIMDPHPEGMYLGHLLDMAQTSMERTPSSGVCIDRQDWIGTVNPNEDDNRTWFPIKGGKSFAPVRAMIHSWKAAMEAFSERWHSEGKVVIINDHSNRLDMMKHVDGIYAEMGDVTPEGFIHSLGSGLVTMNMPAWSWIHKEQSLQVLEKGLQSLLYVGVYPTVPIRNNDHAIGGGCAPHCSYDQLFIDYAPLFLTALAGKRWVLTSHAIRVLTPGGGQGNIFETHVYDPDSLTPRTSIAVVLVQADDSVSNSTVVVNLPIQWHDRDITTVTAIHPGSKAHIPVKWNKSKDCFITIEVPLKRACAVVVIT